MADLQGARALQGRIQQLSSDAKQLLATRDPRPNATLAAQRDKIQEMEKLTTMRGGVVVPVPGEASHKRATEQAREAVLSRGVVEVSPAEHPRKLNPDADLDHELYHRHAERLTNWLDRAKQSTVATGQQLHGRHFIYNFRSYNGSLIESAGVTRVAAAADAQVLPNQGRAHPVDASPASVALSLDARAPHYCRVVRELCSDDSRSPALHIRQLSQLSNNGASGKRPEHLQRTAEGLWDAVSSLVVASTAACEASLPRELARAAACRELLEEDFTAYLRREYAELSMAGTLLLAQHHAKNHLARSGGDLDGWAVAYLCLRAGDIQAFCEAARSQLGDVQLATLAEAGWPPVAPTSSGSLSLRQGGAPLTDFTEERVRANPFKHAIQLLLSRSATVHQVELVRDAMTQSSALKFAQDHVWLHLSFVNAVSAPEDMPRGDAPFSLAYFTHWVEQVPPSELSVPLDPLLYCKVMLWSQCPAKALTALLPPTIVPELAEFALEGLHLGLLLSRYGLLDETSGAYAQLQAQLEAYVLRLVPHDSEAALHYLRLLPEAGTQVVLNAVCQHREARERLLGRVSTDGKVDIRQCAASRFFPAPLCARLASGVAATSRERGSVLLAVEAFLVALYYCASYVDAQNTSASGTASWIVRELLGFLNARLSHAISDMDEAATLSHGTQEALSAARLAFSHLHTLREGASEAESMSVRAFEQLYWIAVLCWNVQIQDNHKAWQAFTSLGILPRTLADVPRLVEELNYRADASTVRKVIHVAVVRVLDLIHADLCSQRNADDRCRLLETAHALDTLQLQLRIQPSAVAMQKLTQRRQVLARMAA